METKEFSHKYHITIKAASEDSIKSNGKEIIDERETEGFIIIAKSGEDQTFCGMVGAVNAFTFGKSIAKMLKKEDMLDRFIAGVKSAKTPESLDELMSMLKDALEEEEREHG